MHIHSSVSHLQVHIHSASHTIKRIYSVSHASECPRIRAFSRGHVSHIQASHIQASHISMCPTSKRLTYPCVPHLQVPIHSSASKCLFIQCHAPRVSHTFGRHSYSYSCLFIRCLTFPSVCSFGVSHTHAYSFGVSHSQAPHIIVCIHSVAIHSVLRALDCLFIQCLMPWVPHISKCLFIQCFTHSSVPHIQASHTSKCLFIQCLTPPSNYSFCVSHIQVPIHSVSHTSKCLTPPSVYSFSVTPPSASHIQASHISKCLFIQCLTPPSNYSFNVSHIQVPIHTVSHTSE
jgi:hypothetical protein